MVLQVLERRHARLADAAVEAESFFAAAELRAGLLHRGLLLRVALLGRGLGGAADHRALSICCDVVSRAAVRLCCSSVVLYRAPTAYRCKLRFVVDGTALAGNEMILLVFDPRSLVVRSAKSYAITKPG